jgi:hypothetical protein
MHRGLLSSATAEYEQPSNLDHSDDGVHQSVQADDQQPVDLIPAIHGCDTDTKTRKKKKSANQRRRRQTSGHRPAADKKATEMRRM